VTLVGLIIAIFGVAFMLGDHPVIGVMLLLLAWVLMMLDGPLDSYPSDYRQNDSEIVKPRCDLRQA